MKTILYNEMQSGDFIIYQKTVITNDSITISQSSNPRYCTDASLIDPDEEVTHERFFGENIARAIRILKKK